MIPQIHHHQVYHQHKKAMSRYMFNSATKQVLQMKKEFNHRQC